MTIEKLGGAAFLLVILIAVGLQVAWIDEPWDDGFNGLCSGAYYGLTARYFDAHGFLETGGLPVVFFHAGVPELTLPYPNHPPLPQWLFYGGWTLFGRDEASLRVISLLSFLVMLLALRGLVRAEGGRRVALFVTAAAASFPVALEYYGIVDAVGLSSCALLLVIAAWFRRQRRPDRIGLVILALAALLNGLLDWHGYGVVIGVTVDALLRPGRRRVALRDALLVVGGFQALALGLHFLWMVWAGNRIGVDLVGAFLDLAGSRPFGDAIDRARWLESTLRFQREGFGLPMLILAGVGLGVAAFRRRLLPADSQLPRCALALGLSGIVPTFVFWQHAAVHPFWPLPLIPAAATLAGCAVQALGGRATWLRVGVPVALIALCALNLVEGARLHDGFRTTRHRDRGAALNALTGPRDLVVTPQGNAADRFYVDAALAVEVKDRATFDALLDRLAKIRADGADLSGIDRLLVLWPESMSQGFDWVLELPLGKPLVIDWGGRKAALVEIDASAWRR